MSAMQKLGSVYITDIISLLTDRSYLAKSYKDYMWLSHWCAFGLPWLQTLHFLLCHCGSSWEDILIPFQQWLLGKQLITPQTTYTTVSLYTCNTLIHFYYRKCEILQINYKTNIFFNVNCDFNVIMILVKT